MKALVDPVTGEVVEVVDPAILASKTAPYDYADAKRAVMDATVEKRRALAEYEKAIDEKAEAEGEYAKVKAHAMKRTKADHGATVAEDMAKGEPDVVEALKRRERAREMVKAWQARLLLSSEDRTSLHRLIEWSMKSPGAMGEARP